MPAGALCLGDDQDRIQVFRSLREHHGLTANLEEESRGEEMSTRAAGKKRKQVVGPMQEESKEGERRNTSKVSKESFGSSTFISSFTCCMQPST